MEIKTVKIKMNGYLVNDELFVPIYDGNRHYEELKIWLETNKPDMDESYQAFLENQKKHIDEYELVKESE